jgi:hypothetical protein
MPRRRKATPPTLPPVAERDVMRQVLEGCALLGIKVHRQNTGGFTDARGQTVRFGRAGDADLTGLLPDARRVEIEVKRPGKWPTPKQIARLREWNAAGAVAFWTHDAGLAVEILQFVLAAPHHRVEVTEAGEVVITDESEVGS